MGGQPVADALPVAMPADPSERIAGMFDAHQERLYRLARRLTSTADDALELVQETFLRAAQSPNSIPVGIVKEEAWLVRVLVNIRRDQWRKAAVRKRHHRSVAESYAATAAADQEAALIVRTTVWRALDILPPRRRAVLVMYELEGLAIPAIATVLGISVITVRWHLSVGRRELTRALKPYIGDVQ